MQIRITNSEETTQTGDWAGSSWLQGPGQPGTVT